MLDLGVRAAFQARGDFPLGSFGGYCCRSSQWENHKEMLEAKTVV